MSAQENSVPVTLRSHTIFGVCEAIGEDFGFNPVLLRVPFAASVLISPTWAIGAYLTLGAIVLLSRVLFPKQRSVAEPVESIEAVETASSQAATSELPLAA